MRETFEINRNYMDRIRARNSTTTFLVSIRLNMYESNEELLERKKEGGEKEKNWLDPWSINNARETSWKALARFSPITRR